MRIELPPEQTDALPVAVRSFGFEDADTLWRHANDRGIWRNLRDAFPSPYSHLDAMLFIQSVRDQRPETVFAIEVEGAAAGSVGFSLQSDVERISAEIGYWLGRRYWGHGIVTAALRAVTRHALEQHGLARLYATPYAWNPASCRVLEKVGYVREGRLRRSAVKDGQIIDKWLYAYVIPEDQPGGAP
jgi:RimJ/RimL family protein N-acetyltransferase